MRTCESYEIDLSSLIDGELPPAAAAEATEHALQCAGCAEFYRSARRVQRAAEGLRAEEGAIDDARADELWSRIESRSREVSSRAFPAARRSLVNRSLRAAALVALGLGGGYLLAGFAGPSSPVSALGSATLASVGRPQAMDEKRFVAVADELLKSDVRYQRAMLEVLRLVPAIESGEGLRNEDEPRVVRASTESERPSRGEI